MNEELLVAHQNLINKHVGLYEKHKQLREVAEDLAKALENIELNFETDGIADEALTRWNELNQKTP